VHDITGNQSGKESGQFPAARGRQHAADPECNDRWMCRLRAGRLLPQGLTDPSLDSNLDSSSIVTLTYLDEPRFRGDDSHPAE
jgi:hypothetical protein